MSGLQLRGDTAANWTTANPVLAAREIALTLNGIGQTVAVRFGDGTTAWTALANFSSGGGGGGVTDGDKGDIVISGAGTLFTIDAKAVTFGKMQDIATARLLGRTTAGAGAVEELNAATAKTLLALVKGDVGLGNADNTSDADKPVSTATATALGGKQSALGFVPENSANKGATNGYVPLVGGQIPQAYLPAFVDDVLEYANFAALPVTGDSGKIYVTLDTNKAWRWSGSAYIEISGSPGSTDAVAEGAANLYFTAARVRDTLLAGLTFATNAAILAADSVLVALGKLQAQITAHFGAGGGAHADAVAAGLSGFMTGGDKTKLNAIAAGATANSSDATLLARANHSGTQLATTISDFTESSQDVIGAMVVNSATVTWTYDDAGGTLSAMAVGAGGVSDGDKGDITVSLAATTWTIDAGAVINAKLANVASATFKGRVTAAAGVPEDLTGTQATSLLDVATGALKGLLAAADKSKLDGIAGGAQPGTVTTVSVTPANGISGTVVNPTTTPVITLALGAIIPTSVAATGAITSSGAAVGYATGAGGAVTQLTSKSTAVTMNKPTGQITTINSALAAATSIAFTLTNSFITATDVVVVNIKSGAASTIAYQATVQAVAAGSCVIALRNVSAGALSEAVVLQFAVIKGVNA